MKRSTIRLLLILALALAGALLPDAVAELRLALESLPSVPAPAASDETDTSG